MSTLDREPRISGGKSTVLIEPRVNTGTTPGEAPLQRANIKQPPMKVPPKGVNTVK